MAFSRYCAVGALTLLPFAVAASDARAGFASWPASIWQVFGWRAPAPASPPAAAEQAEETAPALAAAGPERDPREIDRQIDRRVEHAVERESHRIAHDADCAPWPLQPQPGLTAGRRCGDGNK